MPMQLAQDRFYRGTPTIRFWSGVYHVGDYPIQRYTYESTTTIYDVDVLPYVPNVTQAGGETRCRTNGRVVVPTRYHKAIARHFGLA